MHDAYDPSPTLDPYSSLPGLDPVLTLSQLATQLGVTVQTLYDLRCQGRGLRGFRVGRELRFRVSESPHAPVTPQHGPI